MVLTRYDYEMVLYCFSVCYIFYFSYRCFNIIFRKRERSLLTYASAFIVIVYMWYFGIRFISEFLKDKEEKK